jgi:hypothetical protein
LSDSAFAVEPAGAVTPAAADGRFEEFNESRKKNKKLIKT